MFSRFGSEPSVVAAAVKARRNTSGNVLPRLSALFRIPAAAFADRKYFPAATASRIEPSDEEHSLPTLGHPEVLRVQHGPFDSHRPDLGQRVEAPAHRSASVGVEEPFDVFGNSESWVSSPGSISHLLDDPNGLEEQVGAGAVESCPAAGDGEVLAGEAVGDAVDGCQNTAGTLPTINVCDTSQAITSIV
jgi:hypothetical protein